MIPGLAFAGYWSTLDNAFGLDDFAFVAHLATGQAMSALPGGLTDPLRFIRPLGHLLFYLDHRIWGTWAGGYHLTNFLLHIVNGWLLVAVLRYLWPAIAGAAGCLFVITPFTVEGVAWVSGRFDLLMTSFYSWAPLCCCMVVPGSGLGRLGSPCSRRSRP